MPVGCPDPLPPVPRLADGLVDTAAAAGSLVGRLADERLGQVSASVYETARLVSIAPWLDGHQRRLEFLLAAQQPEGHWGSHVADGYALVPTLSATEALLAAGSGVAREAADRGLKWLSDRLARPARPIPDTCAVEVIVPAMIELIGQRAPRPLPMPASMDMSLLTLIRERLASGGGLPEKVLYVLELTGGIAAGAPGVRPVVPPGTVGASPAATAAWLGGVRHDAAHAPAMAHLLAVVTRHGGLAPTVAPVDVFERVMVLTNLARAGIRLQPGPAVIRLLGEALGDSGRTGGGAGLPVDSETTSITLLALAQLGRAGDLAGLWSFETDTHFNCWSDSGPEITSATSVNGHVLETLGYYAAATPTRISDRHRAAIEKVSGWLIDQQERDGPWQDKWNSSPYYATACSVIPLYRYANRRSASSVGKALEWLVETQKADGSWGRWYGTVEETAYALNTLLLAPAVANEAVHAAAARGQAFLKNALDRNDDPPLWHGKDLYALPYVIRAFAIAALHLAQNDPSVMACTPPP